MEIQPKSSRRRTVLVTGGAGFIGSNLVRRLLREPDCTVIVVDKLTYAGKSARLDDLAPGERYQFYRADISDGERMRTILQEHRPAEVFNLAAESHVDHSIERPGDFLQAIVTRAFSLLEEVRS